ncbi:MAG TPA: hypothetical protein DDW76_04680 [Cyanobacteria bacterium UBA11369]|nr:hypothetical protein [Cyanobacteria bacterium UBA11371]HBE35585.1 hypothetical protein [Cyanobacteria bacterium UBA11368]HBE48102.1 hypothetical protein [Cyanobacteria bacterium UBA11369]
MKKREDIVQKFSTFLRFVDYKGGQKTTWQADPQLERHMKSLVESDPEAKEEFWTRHFLKSLRELFPQESTHSMQFSTTTSKIEKHLSAYLQEACIWAAQKTHQKYNFLRHKYAIEEYFQIACSFANLPAKLFKSFNLDRPNSNLEAYAKTAILRFIRDKIYQQDIEAKRVKFSEHGLLKDLNNKELQEALASTGLKQPQIDLYRLAWQCFDEIYQVKQTFSSQSLAPPNQEYLKQITSCYNDRLKNLNFSATPVNEEKIKAMLQICTQAARDYRTKNFLPLQDFETMSDSMPTLWDTIVQEEEREQVQLIVSRLFESIPEPGQTMLKLWQGLNLTQTEIATVMKNKYPELQKQYQVNRHLSRYTRNLLRDFVSEWNKINPEFSLNDEKDIARVKESFEECLESHCKRFVYSLIERIIEERSCEEKREKKPILGLYNPKKEVKRSLRDNLNIKLEKLLNIPVNSPILFQDKIANLIEEWLRIKPHKAESGVRENDT